MSSAPSGPGSSDRPAPDVGIGAVYRGRDIRVAGASQSVVVLLVLMAWAIAAGPQAEALDDAGIFSGMATALVAVVGAVVATVRGPGRADAGARLLRTSYALPALLVLVVLQIPLAVLARVLGEDLIYVVLGSMIGLGLAGLGGCLLGLIVAGSVLGWTEAPPGTGFAGRSAWAVLILATLVMAVALALGSRVEVRGRANILGLIVALLGLPGYVRSEAWLWVARAAVGVMALAVFLIVRTFRRGRA